MASPTQYTVKPGDTLNKIAASQGFANYKEAGITGFDNPDMIQPGQVLTIGGGAPAGPVVKDVPGIGTLTVTPKTIPAVPKTPTDGVGANPAGLYERTGVQPPAPVNAPGTPATPTGYTAPKVAGMPGYPSAATTPKESMLESYNTLLSTINGIEERIRSASTPSSVEKDLQTKLNEAKSRLATFDVSTLESQEALRGQGRGITKENIGIQDSILSRSRALERLGFATEANTLATLLSTATADRSSLGELAKTEYGLATKRLDIALGIQDELSKIADKEQDSARQYLLDVVNFAEGKSYDALDVETQAAITDAVANSPITLGMVKTALKSGAEKAAAAARGELRSVAGVGVVQIDPKTGRYKVVVPENPADGVPPAGNKNAPSFNKYLADQGTPLETLNDMKIKVYRAEYDRLYPNGEGAGVTLGKLTATDKNQITQAGLTTAPAAVQSYFLNSPSEFQDTFQRDVASGKIKGTQSLDQMIAAYTAWYNEKNKKSGTRDWSQLLAPSQ